MKHRTEECYQKSLLRAWQSLEGLSCGDAFGQRFFGNPELVASLIHKRTLPPPPWTFTDDTMMALSIVSILEEHTFIDQDHLALSFAKNYDPSRGYGPAMHGLLARIRAGYSWRRESRALFGGQGSFGNGSAMRVAPVGAYFADDLEKIVTQAELSAITTHCHPEAIAGAIAVAVAAGIAWQCRESPPLPSPPEFLRRVYRATPVSQVRSGIQRALELPQNTSIKNATAILGNGRNATAQDTVPFALWCAASHLESYEDALWTTVSGLGDRDTTCAIVGGIVVMCAGLESMPNKWLECREPIPIRSVSA
jgi:ADP-ribosylglycohydrolase